MGITIDTPAMYTLDANLARRAWYRTQQTPVNKQTPFETGSLQPRGTAVTCDDGHHREMAKWAHHQLDEARRWQKGERRCLADGRKNETATENGNR